jgi:hypothetical protein
MEGVSKAKHLICGDKPLTFGNKVFCDVFVFWHVVLGKIVGEKKLGMPFPTQPTKPTTFRRQFRRMRREKQWKFF